MARYNALYAAGSCRSDRDNAGIRYHLVDEETGEALCKVRMRSWWYPESGACATCPRRIAKAGKLGGVKVVPSAYTLKRIAARDAA